MHSTQSRLALAMTKVLHVDGCWRWTGRISPTGYGQIHDVDGRTVGAHRWFYEQVVGPVPAGLELDHLCRIRNCVNPEHLEPVTHAENMRRAQLSRCKRGHEFTPENTYIRPGKYPRRVCRQCKSDWTKARAAA